MSLFAIFFIMSIFKYTEKRKEPSRAHLYAPVEAQPLRMFATHILLLSRMRVLCVCIFAAVVNHLKVL